MEHSVDFNELYRNVTDSLSIFQFSEISRYFENSLFMTHICIIYIFIYIFIHLLCYFKTNFQYWLRCLREDLLLPTLPLLLPRANIFVLLLFFLDENLVREELPPSLFSMSPFLIT